VSVVDGTDDAESTYSDNSQRLSDITASVQPEAPRFVGVSTDDLRLEHIYVTHREQRVTELSSWRRSRHPTNDCNRELANGDRLRSALLYDSNSIYELQRGQTQTRCMRTTNTLTSESLS